MAELDAFSSAWEHIGPDQVPLVRVTGCDVVPMSRGLVAMLITTSPHLDANLARKTQAVMSPGYARKMAASLLEAANMVSPTN